MNPRYRFAAARTAYVGVILIAVLAGLQFSPELSGALDRLGRAFVPALGWNDAIDGLRNLALFAGLGVVWVVTSTHGDVRRDIRRVTLVGLATSLLVEGLQLFSPVRQASIVDIATNTVGTLLGAVAIALLAARVSAARQSRSYFGVPAFLLAAGYGFAVLCEALTPLFRSIPIAGADGDPLRRMDFALAFALPLSASQISITDFLLVAPAGFLAVVVLAESKRDGTGMWLVVALVGAALLAGAEIGHGMLGIPVRFEAAGVYAGAFIVGAIAARLRLGRMSRELRGAARARALTIAFVLLLCLWGWRPFWPISDLSLATDQLTLARFVPLAALSEREDVFSALHVVQTFWLYAPLGALLAVWPMRLRGAWSHLRPVVWIAPIIEAGHLVVAGRFFDMTNAMLGFGGAAVAWLLVRRCGFTPYGETWPQGSPARGRDRPARE